MIFSLTYVTLSALKFRVPSLSIFSLCLCLSLSLSLSSYPTSSNFDDVDASSLLDVSTELIAETPIKPTQRSPESLYQDVIKLLEIVTEKQDQAGAANTNNIYNAKYK